MLSSKWILFCFILSTLILSSAYAQPTPTSIVKRQEETNTIIELNHATVTSRKHSSTTTTFASATATSKGGNESNNNGTPPAIIPAQTTAWFGKFIRKSN